MRKLGRTVTALAAGVVAAVALTACGGGGSSASPATASTPAPVPTAPSQSTPAAPGPAGVSGGAGGAVTNYVDYTGGKAGAADPSKKPVYIGFINTQGGQVLVGPGATPGAQSAVEYVNTHLDGVDGHPLKLVTCFTRSSEEEGTKCGQQFANDKRISVVLMGALAVGNQSFYAALGGTKPIVAGVILLPVDTKQRNEFALFGSSDSVLGPWGTFAKQYLHAKTAAVVYPQIAGIDVGAKAEKESLEAAGVKTTLVGYDPNATDLVGPLTAAKAQTADVIVPQSNAAGCVNLAQALGQLGKKSTPVVSNPLCLDPAVAKGLGGDFPHWIYGIASTLTADTSDPASRPLAKALAQLGQSKLGSDAWVITSWGEVLTTVRLMNEIGVGSISPTTLTDRLRAFKGPQALGAPSLDCGKYPSEPAVCNDQTQFFRYEGHFVFKRIKGWTRPPADWKLGGS